MWSLLKVYNLALPELREAIDKNTKELAIRAPFVELINKQFIDATSGAQSIYLTDGLLTEQDQYVVKIDASVNAVTIYPFSGQTINGAASYPLAAQYDSVLLTFKTNCWYII